MPATMPAPARASDGCVPGSSAIPRFLFDIRCTSPARSRSATGCVDAGRQSVRRCRHRFLDEAGLSPGLQPDFHEYPVAPCRRGLVGPLFWLLRLTGRRPIYFTPIGFESIAALRTSRKTCYALHFRLAMLAVRLYGCASQPKLLSLATVFRGALAAPFRRMASPIFFERRFSKRRLRFTTKSLYTE